MILGKSLSSLSLNFIVCKTGITIAQISSQYMLLFITTIISIISIITLIHGLSQDVYSALPVFSIDGY